MQRQDLKTPARPSRDSLVRWQDLLVRWRDLLVPLAVMLVGTVLIYAAIQVSADPCTGANPYCGLGNLVNAFFMSLFGFFIMGVVVGAVGRDGRLGLLAVAVVLVSLVVLLVVGGSGSYAALLFGMVGVPTILGFALVRGIRRLSRGPLPIVDLHPPSNG